MLSADSGGRIPVFGQNVWLHNRVIEESHSLQHTVKVTEGLNMEMGGVPHDILNRGGDEGGGRVSCQMSTLCLWTDGLKLPCHLQHVHSHSHSMSAVHHLCLCDFLCLWPQQAVHCFHQSCDRWWFFLFFFSFFDFSYLECVNVIGYSGLKFGDLNLELISKHLTVSGKQLTW